MSLRKWGIEHLVNTTTFGVQDEPVVTSLEDGGYVIAWQDRSAQQPNVRFQIYNADGSERGGEVSAPLFGNIPNSEVEIAALDDGGFVLTFERQFSPTDFNPLFQRYDANGNQVGGVGNIDGSLGIDDHSAVSSFGSGFVSVFRDADLNSGDIVLRAFDEDGIATIGTVVNNVTSSFQSRPDVVEIGGGRIAVVWQDSDTVRGRVFEPNGTPVGNDFFIANTGFIPADPKITALENGGFVVTYTDSSTSFPESSYGVRASIFTPDGQLFGSEIIVNSTFQGFQWQSDVTALPNGGFFIAWSDANHNSIRGQAFDVLGNRQGTEVIISTQDVDVPASGDSVSVSSLGDGRVVVTWSDTNSPEDPSVTGIFSQIIDPRGSGGSVVYGTGNGDMLYGNYTADELNGLGGDDTLIGMDGIDALFGGDGNDMLNGGRGGDMLIGGDGIDFATYYNSDVRVSIRLDTNVISDGDAEGDTLIGIEDVWGTQFDDYLAGDSGDNKLSGYGGNDYLRGNEGADRLDGGNGTDLVSYHNSNARVVVRLDKNSFTGGHAEGDRLLNIEDVAGSQYNDYISGNSARNKLYGLDGDDYLRGIGGDDRLVGGWGNDLLQGGSGNDTFVFKENYDQDTIDDFDPGRDTIELEVNGVNSFSDLTLQTSGSDVRIDFGGGDVLVISNTTVAALDQDDFSFV